VTSSPCSLVAAKVVFIGAGPGEADLITVRGSRLLGQAQVVLFDALADPSLRDLAPHAAWIDVGKRGFPARKAATSTARRGSTDCWSSSHSLWEPPMASKAW